MPISLLTVKTHLVIILISVDYAHNFNDCANILDDQMNTPIDSTNMSDISSLNLYILNPVVLQLLFICRSKIKIVFIARFVIHFLSSSFFIYGFYISHPSLSSSISKFAS